jgi:uncharacterized membrane protein YidH (DUF202 family)
MDAQRKRVRRWGIKIVAFLVGVVTFALTELGACAAAYQMAGGDSNDVWPAMAIGLCVFALPVCLIAVVGAGWFAHAQFGDKTNE